MVTAVVVSAGLLICGVTGCMSSHAGTSKDFAAIDAAVASMQTSGIGPITSDKRYGQSRISSDPPTRELVVTITSDAADALRRTETALQSSGFIVDSPPSTDQITVQTTSIWNKLEGSIQVRVYFSLTPGSGSSTEVHLVARVLG